MRAITGGERHSSQLMGSGFSAFTVLSLAMLLGAAHLLVVAGFRVALTSLPLWQNPSGDLAQSVLGAEAFLRDPSWHLPLAATDRLLADGRPLSIVYTDSAPWIAIAAKAAGLDETSVSVIGLVLCLNFLLQPVAFATLLLAEGARRVEVVVLGAVLGAMLPAWYMRAPGHVALSSHWLIVLALALAVRAVRARVSPVIVTGLCALGALALGIHAYLFVMVAAVAAGGLLADLARRGWPALPRAVAGVAAFLAASAASAWLLGYGAGGGGVGGFGLYSMNLLSPFMPQVSGLSEMITGDAGPVVDATGGQYEGYNYLGAGVLLVLVLAVVGRALSGPAALSTPQRRAGFPLVLALAALTALALSNRVFAGHVPVLSTRVPGRAFLDELRSSGRLFWPVAYALLALALAGLDGAPRRGLAAVALALAVALQLTDTATLRRDVEQAYAAPPALPTPALDPWRHGPLAGRDVRLLPRFLCATRADEALGRELSLVVVRAGGRVEGGPSARMRPDACIDDQFAAVAAQAPGRWIDVLLRQSLSPPTLTIASEARRCTALALGAVCRTGVVLAPDPERPASALAPLHDGERVDLTGAGDGRRLEGPGWSDPEAFGAWTEGKHALLVLPLAPDWEGGITVTAEARAYAPPPRSSQEVLASVNGHPIAHWRVLQEFGRFEAEVPRTLWTGGAIVLDLAIPGALSPYEAERAPDDRTLGIAVRSVTVRASH